MARKVFLSFLGTSIYKPTYYKSQEKSEEETSSTRFVQEAIVRQYCSHFGKGDKIFVFTTNEAMENWKSDIHLNKHTKETIVYDSLKKRLVGLNLDCDIANVEIPNGKSTAEIWDIFQIVFKKIEQNDKITFDITHGFRSLPMLNIVLINYAKFLRDISVSGIFYGNWEARYRKNNKTFSPIWDLKDFEELQDWTNAANIFLNTGDAEKLQKLAYKEIRPLLQESETRTPETKSLNLATKELKKLTENITTNRGFWLDQYDVNRRILSKLKQYTEGEQQILPAFEPLIDRINKDLELFHSEKIPKWFAAAEYCFKKGLFQQSYTQLQEGIKVEVLKRVRKEFDLNPYSETHQKIASEAFYILSKLSEDSNFPEEKWAKTSRNNKEISKVIQEMDFVKKIRPVYITLEDLRNDINHGGYKKRTKAGKLIYRLEELIGDTERILLDIPKENTFEVHPILINLSNHPSEKWLKNQKQTALEQYDEIRDMAFPKIDPSWTSEEIEQLAGEYEAEIKKIAPAAVHVMGEMTFTHTLVTRLKNDGISCVASTTERVVTEDEKGNKTSQFRFFRFRRY